ncbi:MAG: hypothetical protein IPK19_22130 [Chloroflexi bacterium]|nr:hypothetical protein [Chloroflexota bacterium]
MQPQIETLPLLGSSDHAVTVDEAVARIQAASPALDASFAWRDYFYPTAGTHHPAADPACAC